MPLDLKLPFSIQEALERQCRIALSERTDRSTEVKIDGRVVYQSFHLDKDRLPDVLQYFSSFGFEVKNYLISVMGLESRPLPPHIDKNRRASLFYKYTNDQAVTRFYDGPGPGRQETGRFYLPADLKKIGELTIESKTLYLFNHQAIHEVDNISEMRCSITINLEQDYAELVEKVDRLQTGRGVLRS